MTLSDYLTLRSAATFAVNRYKTDWPEQVTPRQVEVAQDPRNPDVIAIRVTRRNRTHDFTYGRSLGIRSIREAEFKHWPPFTRGEG